MAKESAGTVAEFRSFDFEDAHAAAHVERREQVARCRAKDSNPPSIANHNEEKITEVSAIATDQPPPSGIRKLLRSHPVEILITRSREA